jgi:hypothetical protein
MINYKIIDFITVVKSTSYKANKIIFIFSLDFYDLCAIIGVENEDTNTFLEGVENES